MIKGSTDNTSFYLYSEDPYWLASANNFYNHMIVQTYVTNTGKLNGSHINATNIGVRPAILIKPGFTITSGTETTETPYIISFNNT